jgi:hypothetical protein
MQANRILQKSTPENTPESQRVSNTWKTFDSTTLCFESTIVSPCSNLFGAINGKQLVVRNLILWFCNGQITTAQICNWDICINMHKYA